MSTLRTIYKSIELLGPDEGGTLEGPWAVETSMSQIIVVRITDGVVVPWHNVALLSPDPNDKQAE